MSSLIFAGFYRYFPSAPSPLEFLCTDGASYFRQRIDINGKIQSYLPFNIESSSRIRLPDTKRLMVPEIGDDAIFAYEYDEGEFFIANHGNIRKHASSLLTSHLNSPKNPFAMLDLAELVGDDVRVAQFREKCDRKLASFAPRITVDWASGTSTIKSHETSSVDEKRRRVIVLRSPSVFLKSLRFLSSQLEGKFLYRLVQNDPIFNHSTAVDDLRHEDIDKVLFYIKDRLDSMELFTVYVTLLATSEGKSYVAPSAYPFIKNLSARKRQMYLRRLREKSGEPDFMKFRIIVSSFFDTSSKFMTLLLMASTLKQYPQYGEVLEEIEFDFWMNSSERRTYRAAFDSFRGDVSSWEKLLTSA